jgi:hypothetical protein
MSQISAAGLAALSAALLASLHHAQSTAVKPVAKRVAILSDGHTRIADPKLTGGGASAAFHVQGQSVTAQAEIHGPAGVVKALWSGTLAPGAAPTSVAWDGRDAGGQFVPTGSYELRVSAAGGGAPGLVLPIEVVRLGITELEFQDSPAGNDEWQMVYFKKGTQDGVFYATPAIHEYANTKSPGEISDLDLNDGSPRPPVGLHTATDIPVMDGADYEGERYNYPLAYVRGASPRLEATLGDGGTTAAGLPMACSYPVAGYDLRLRVTFPGGEVAVSGPLVPGAKPILDGPALPLDVGRYSLSLTWTWQYAPSGTGAWSDVPGASATEHRVYTLHAAPKFKAGASGTQYTGPWVEVAEKFAQWKSALGFETASSAGVVQTFVRGFFGQNGGIPTAIEGVIYDAYPLGGDGGATHYFQSFGNDMDLSALLNGHAKGVYVNCTDNMGSETTMLSMLGIPAMRPVRLGPMTLKAIWGIGSPAYTTSLWGSSHSFSYHHIATRTDGVDVIDTCMQLDEDGSPSVTPGIPGWNHDRLWAGPTGYAALSCSNPVTKTLESLPGLL